MLSLILCIIFISFGIIALILFLLEKTKRYSVKGAMIKSACSLLFIAVAAVGLYKNEQHVLSLYVTLGLLLGLLGDIWLDFKYVYREHDDIFTYAGFIMFSLGHVLYIAGLFHEYYHGENPLYIILPLVVGTIFGVANAFLEKIMKLRYGKKKWIVILYGSLLFSMAFTTLSLSIMTGFTHVNLTMFFVGGILFAISDLVLSGTYFGEGKERPIDIITNGITYYAAQYVIAFSLFFI